MMKRKLLAGLLGMLLALPAAAVDLGKLFGDGSNGTIDIGKVTEAPEQRRQREGLRRSRRKRSAAA